MLRADKGTFDTENCTDLYAREKWFYQAQIESPAMFARHPGAGSPYWLGLRDAIGNYLMSEHTYRLDVPVPVPAKLFWSITTYDARSRSEIAAEQNRAALRSMFELADSGDSEIARLWFGPTRPEGGRREPLGADAARRWMVCVLPHLRSGSWRLRWELETW